MTLRTIPCTLMRGGTSKGVFFRKEFLPPPGKKRNDTLLKIFGSGDPMQLDGLGGAQVQSSKTMIVSKSERSGVDLDYLFGQVSVDGWFVDYAGNCGNLTSAIAPFGIDEGLLRVRGSKALVRLYNVNTKKRVDATIPLEQGKTKYDGNYMIDGVPRPGARIDVTWHDPAGAMSGKLLPTGNVVDRISVNGKVVNCSIVDAGNPVAFVDAAEVGLEGAELPGQVSRGVLDLLEAVRSEAACMMGLVDAPADATKMTPHMPFIAAVTASQDYVSSEGRKVTKKDYGVLARLFSMQKMHHAYAATGAICTAVASKVPGSVVNQVSRDSGETVVIGHPKGLIDLQVRSRVSSESLEVGSVTLGRTARRLMSGVAYYTA
ncbi:MAG TPA: PrpF domain-containing protein [Nitrososphaerales archaeon]|nr:PrpF domain-containing protein [Nitrososphaerales archaeon]